MRGPAATRIHWRRAHQQVDLPQGAAPNATEDPIDTTFRIARRDDVPVLVAMLADDFLGAAREEPGPPLPGAYQDAFDAIDRDPNQDLVVAEHDGRVVGFLQITYVPSLSYRGRWRAIIESVRVAADVRGHGIGRRLVEDAIRRARERGCHVVQLTSDKRRRDAVRFYEGLGFRASHEGLKKFVDG